MIRTLLSALLLAAWVTMPAIAGPWLEDFDTAKRSAAASGKPILVDVTGSDWCPPCQAMETEVFSRADFIQAAQARYILLRLDYPRQTPQSEKLRAQNRQLAERYPFEGYPTYMLLDSQGLLYGQYTGYLPGGVSAFLKMTQGLEGQKKTLVSLTDAVKKASAGADRARAQDALFRQAEVWGLEAQYGDLPLKIVQEDKDGKAGLKGRYQVFNAYQRLLATWSNQSDFRKAVTDLEQLAGQAAPWPDLKQKIVFTKGMIWLNALSDEVQARTAMKEAKALGAETAVGLRAAELLDQLP